MKIASSYRESTAYQQAAVMKEVYVIFSCSQRLFLCFTQLGGGSYGLSFDQFRNTAPLRPNIKCNTCHLLCLCYIIVNNSVMGIKDPRGVLHMMAPPERGIFLRLQVYERLGILLSGSLQKECMRTAKIGPDLRLKVEKTFYFCD